MVGERLRGRWKAGADAKVVGAVDHRGPGLAHVVRRAAQEAVGADHPPGERHRQIVGPHVGSVGRHGGRHVDAIVHHHDRPQPAGIATDDRQRRPHPLREQRNGQGFVAHLDHPHACIDQRHHESGERVGVAAAIDQHAQRHAIEPIASPRGGERRPLQRVHAVAERLEARHRVAGHDRGGFLEGAERLGRPGGVRRDEVGQPDPGERRLRLHTDANVTDHVAGAGSSPEAVPGERSGEVVAEVLGRAGEVLVAEAEPEHVLEHPQRLGAAVRRGVDHPPDAGGALPSPSAQFARFAGCHG